MTLLSLLGIHFGICFLLVTVTWLLYLIFKRMVFIDITWVIGFVVLAIFDFVIYTQSITNVSSTQLISYIIVVSLIAIWGFRLAIFFFFTRILTGHEDKRYAQIKASYQSNTVLNVYYNFLFQGFLQALISISFIPLMLQPTLTSPPWLWVIFAIVAISGEFLADWQLYQFKTHHKGKGIFKQGLWRFSRHPNYFFDVLFWFSIASYTFTLTNYYVAFVGPVLLYCIMRWITGRITENLSRKKYGAEFEDYAKQTPMIIPNIFNIK